MNDLKPEHVANTDVPIVTVDGIDTVLRPLHRVKQLLPIVSRPSHRLMLWTSLQFWNAFAPIDLTLTGISILWVIVPGYFLVLLLSFFVPPIFTAIAFDSGGVASGPMTAAFLLPLAIGACLSVGGNVVTDAFGVVAMVAMTPLITLQILGLICRLKDRRRPETAVAASPYAELDDYAIIEL